MGTRARRADACATYSTTEKCEDEAPPGCVWAPSEPGEWDQALYHCVEESCETLSITSSEPDVECKARSKTCTWNEDVYFCSTTGNGVPCTLYYAEEDGAGCPAECEYSKVAEKCITKGSQPRCTDIYSEVDCQTVSKCQFISDIYKCWEKGDQVPCKEYEYYSEDECPNYCKWVPIGDGVSNSGGSCLGQDEIEACEEYGFSEDGHDCPESRCQWYPELRLCFAKDKDVPCMKLPGEQCAPEGRCQWYPDGPIDGIDSGSGSCDICPDGKTNCKSTYVGPTDIPPGGGPDDGKPCATHVGQTIYQCPEPRCFLEVPGEDSYSCGGDDSGAMEVCRDSTCADMLWNPDDCAKKSECVYDEDHGICSDPTKPFPCSDLYDATECGTQDACAWSDPGGCNRKGEPIACSRYYSSDTCPGTTCQWSEMAWECSETNKKLPCPAYGSEGDCPPADGCSWKNGLCWEEDEDPPCSAYCTAFQCDATGSCMFDKNTYMCVACQGSSCPTLKECSTYKTESTCPDSKCDFRFSDPGSSGDNKAGVCADKVCADIYQSAECKAKSSTCSWSGSDMEGACTPKGYTVPCDKFFEADQCTANGCQYDAAEFSCIEKGGKEGCHAFNENTCGTGDAKDCEFKDWACSLKVDVLPDAPTLSGKGDGTGSEDEAKCTPALFDKVKEKLELAERECVEIARRSEERDRRDASKLQLQCLEYYLEMSPGATTAATACPCLWFYANEISPYEDHWMQIAC